MYVGMHGYLYTSMYYVLVCLFAHLYSEYILCQPLKGIQNMNEKTASATNVQLSDHNKNSSVHSQPVYPVRKGCANVIIVSHPEEPYITGQCHHC